MNERILIGQQLDSATSPQQAAFAVFAEHRKDWVQVLDDGAGDGYFYDPKRTETEGSFFYNLAEGNYYVWFPSFRNFLSGVIDCYETRTVKLSVDGGDLEENYDETEKIWRRVGTITE